MLYSQKNEGIAVLECEKEALINEKNALAKNAIIF